MSEAIRNLTVSLHREVHIDGLDTIICVDATGDTIDAEQLAEAANTAMTKLLKGTKDSE